MLCVLEVPEVTRCVLLCMLEAVDGELCLPEVMCRVLLCILEAVEGELYLLEVLGVAEVMYCVRYSSMEDV